MRFFVGRAELLNEQLENALTDALSELGKFDAEARKFAAVYATSLERPIVKLKQLRSVEPPQRSSAGSQPVDLQVIDELRAEIALLRAELHAIVAILCEELRIIGLSL